MSGTSSQRPHSRLTVKQQPASVKPAVPQMTIDDLKLTASTITQAQHLNEPHRSAAYRRGIGYSAADLVGDALLGRRPNRLIATGRITAALWDQVQAWVAANRDAALGHKPTQQPAAATPGAATAPNTESH